MPQLNIEKQPAKIEIPQQMLEDPLALEHYLAKQAGMALNAGFVIMDKIKGIKKIDPQDTKAEKLSAKLQTEQTIMATKLAELGLEVTSKKEKVAEKITPQQEQLSKWGKFAEPFTKHENALATLDKTIDVNNITPEQGALISENLKIMNELFRADKTLTDPEKKIVMESYLPMYKKFMDLKKEINRNEKMTQIMNDIKTAEAELKKLEARRKGMSPYTMHAQIEGNKKQQNEQKRRIKELYAELRNLQGKIAA